MTTTQTIIWILTGVVVVVGFVMLVSRAIRGGKNPGLPTTTQYDTQDAPPPKS